MCYPERLFGVASKPLEIIKEKRRTPDPGKSGVSGQEK
jgi:hypothetical protein